LKKWPIYQKLKEKFSGRGIAPARPDRSPVGGGHPQRRFRHPEPRAFGARPSQNPKYVTDCLFV